MEATVVEQLMALLLVAFLVGLLIRRLFVPYTVALLVVGVAISFTGLTTVSLTSQTILVVFLPALLFQAAINLELEELRAAVLPIALLAIVGVGVTIAIVAGLFSFATGIPALPAVVLATMLSATDPVAVLAIFKRMGVPKRLEMVIEGESLFNDGTALVAFEIALGAASSARVSIPEALGEFVLVVAGGLALGAATGFVFCRLMALTTDHLFEMGLSTVLAYGSYLLGEAVHVSPVITVVAAGIVLGNYGRRLGLSERARTAVIDIWEYLAFIANSVIFLLIGQQMRSVSYSSFLLPAAVAIGLVLISRAAVVYGGAPIAARLQRRQVPFSWRHVTFWGGLRGALAIAMALSLPANFPYRDLLISATFSVVFFTILVQGISMEHLVRRLKLREPAKQA